MSQIDCAEEASEAKALELFAVLAEDQPTEEVDASEVIAAYNRALPPPPPPPPTPQPRRLSGWKLSKALDKREMLNPLVEYLKTDNYALVAFFRPQYFMEDDPDFIAISRVMREKFGIEEKMWDEIIEESVDLEGKEA